MPIKLLFADDSPVMRERLKDLFCADRHWEVCLAENGREAVSQMQSLHPDVVILDLSMPVMNGLEAAVTMHQMKPQLPIVIYTIHSSPQLETEAIRAGVRQVVSKANPDELLIAIKSALVKYPLIRPARPAMA
jgi:DNA-binding NarL/FixJ family response regulator